MPGKLYVVATPIGNLGDISARAIEVLKKVDYVLTEDSRVTSKLLNHYEIDKPILIYHQHSSEQKKLEILSKLLNGNDLALVTDAGTPGISDPGNELVDFIHQRSTQSSVQNLASLPAGKAGRDAAGSLRADASEINIIPVPGPSAVTTTLSICGFNVKEFTFVGFLPKKKRSKLFSSLFEDERAIAFFESPYRLKKTLEELKEYVGDRRIFVARELTKKFESTYRGQIDEVIKILPNNIKGEVVVVVEGK